MPHPSEREIIFLTPSLNGADGISTLCRQSILACKGALGSHRIRVWSLTDGKASQRDDAEPSVDYFFADESRFRYAWRGMGQVLHAGRRVHLVVFHVGLAPLALPYIWRGAEVSVLLLGIEVWRRLTRFQASTLRRASRILSISNFTAREFMRHNPAFSDTPIDVCHLGAETVKKGGRGTRSEAPFALIVARMSFEERYKGHDQLLDAWPSVLARVPDARLVVAGDGDDRQRLEQKAVALGIENHVQFRGRVSDSQLADLYQQCSFFVMPSPREGFGLVFLEAMRAEKACIGAPGAAAEIIRHGETGLIVNPDDQAELASALVTLFQESNTCGRMGKAGADRFHGQFTDKHFQQRFNSLLGLDKAA